MNNEVLSHTGKTRLVTLEQLSQLAEPTSQGRFHKPINHARLVDELTRQFAAAGLEVAGSSFALSKDDQRLFGVLRFHQGPSKADFSAALGFRQANDRSMGLSAVAGVSVMVCDNLALHGELIAMKERHTKGLDLAAAVTECLGKFVAHFETLTHGIQQLKRLERSDESAKSIAVDAAEAGVIGFSAIPYVLKEWREPRHEEFKPRTAWSLHNAFTEVLKKAPLARRLKATTALGKVFGV